jgi:hypothetical protein
MVYFEKSQPAPKSLANKKSWLGEDVLSRLKEDFKNKCYLCEQKEPNAINVEHFVPRNKDKNLEFDWNNLFFACVHCNSTKSDKYHNLLNCTLKDDDVENKLKYIFVPFPKEQVEIAAIDKSSKSEETKALLLDIYNGTTPLKKLESANLRKRLLDEIEEFQALLQDYQNVKSEHIKKAILSHINRASNFTAFKRWIIKENPKLKVEFERYFD